MPNVWQISQHDAPFTVDYSTRSLACDWQMCVLFGREVNLRHHYMISPTLLEPTDKLSLMLICSRIRHASFKIFWCSFVIVRADKTDGEVLWPCPDTGESQYAPMHDCWYLWSRRRMHATVKIPACFDRNQVGSQVLLNTPADHVIV